MYIIQILSTQVLATIKKWLPLTKTGFTSHSLVPRPHPDFISQPFSPRLRDKIWVGPGDEATSHTLHILQSGAFFVFLRTVGQLAFMCSTEPQALQPPPNQVREHHFSVFAKLHVKALVTFWVKSTRVVRTWPWKVTNLATDKTLSIGKLT